MPVTRIRLKNFTAFKDLEVEFSPGINALVGANGTGKTHLMKACYAACDATKTHEDFATKLVKVFVASGRSSGRVVQQGNGSTWRGATVEVDTEAWRFRADIDADEGICGTDVPDARSNVLINAVYIPVKEMLANAPGFLSLYALRDLHFEEVYQDILLRAYLPALRESVDDSYQEMLDCLQELIGGKITVIGEEFFLSNERGDLIFDLVAEGWRKLGLLWLLIRNGALQKGSVLFWDEPEASLNPKVFKVVIEVLLELQRVGVQVFFATHDYVILKELDLQMMEKDAVAFHSLYRDEEGEIACRSTGRYLDIHPNAISEAFTELYDREIERSFGEKLR